MLAFVIFGAKLLSFALSDLGVLENLTQIICGLNVKPIVILCGIYILYLALGCFFEGLSMMVMTLPITYPIIIALGYDPVWFGIILVLLIETALITPPVGLNLFVIQGTTPGISTRDIMIGALPFVFTLILMIAIVTIFPQLALWLPDMVFTTH